MMEVRVLGPLEVVGTPTPTRPAQRRLLAVLALDAGHAVNRDVLIERLWGEAPPATAVNTLQAHVSGLRRHLGDRVSRTGAAYRLDVPRDAVDVHVFADAVARARRLARANDWDGVTAAVDGALALWRGDPLADLDAAGLAPAVLAGLWCQHDELARLRCRAQIAVGAVDDARVALEALVHDHPHDEQVWELLMLARARTGERVAALAAYREAWSALAEVGCGPGARLVRLQRALLVGAPLA